MLNQGVEIIKTVGETNYTLVWMEDVPLYDNRIILPTKVEVLDAAEQIMEQDEYQQN